MCHMEISIIKQIQKYLIKSLFGTSSQTPNYSYTVFNWDQFYPGTVPSYNSSVYIVQSLKSLLKAQNYSYYNYFI